MAHWRDSARRPRFYFIEAWAAFPMLLFLLHIRLWTFLTAFIATVFFSLLERYGFSVKTFFRWFLGLLGGNRKMARPWWI